MNRILFGFILWIVALSSMAKKDVVTPTTEKNFVDTIKISYINYAIIVPVNIDGKSYRFMFDTGCTYSLINDTLRYLMQETGKKLEALDFNKVKKCVDLGSIQNIKLGNIHLNDVRVGVMENNLPIQTIDGIIGMRELNKNGIITKFDLKDSIIILTDRKDFFAEEKGQVMNFYPKNACPHVKFSMSHGCKEKWILFDTGSNGFMTLNNYYYKKSMKGKDKELFTKQIEWKDTGSAYYSVHGLEKTNEQVFMRLDEVRIDDVHINKIPTVVSTGSTTLGCRILEYGSMIMNPLTHTLTFQPYDQTSENINITQSNRNFAMFIDDGIIRVAMINPNGEEYKKGLRKGDRLIECDGTSVTSPDDYLRLKPHLSQLDSYMVKFRNTAGDVIEIEIKKN